MTPADSLPETSARPLVTVITATFNLIKAGCDEHFRRCVEAVHAQSYQPIEHLIIDGASTDGTLDILREYEQKGWVKLYSEPDKGIYDAFNKGIERASGKYCSFMNSDDLWHDRRGIETSVYLLERLKADFSYAPATYVLADGSGSFVREPDMAAFFCRVPTNHQAMFYRTDVLREYKYDLANYRLAADFELTTRLLLSGRKGVYVPLNFTTFRLGGFSGDTGMLEDESKRIFRQHYGPLIGDDAADRLVKWVAPDRLIRCLGSMVQPDIMAQVERSFVPLYTEGEELLRVYRPWVNRQHTQTYSRRSWKGLLGLLQMKSVESGSRVVYRLFSFLPLFSREYRYDMGYCDSRSWLLGFLPLWKCSCKGETTRKHYLFHIIPVWSSKLS